MGTAGEQAQPVGAWWTQFGDDYDTAEQQSSSGVRPPRTEEVLADQMVLNQRTLANLKAKSQLLEVAETSAARLRSELAEVRATTEAREAALQSALADARTAVDALQAGLSSQTAAADRARKEATAARFALETQRAENQQHVTTLTSALREASEARDDAEAGLREAHDSSVVGESERRALKAALEDERSGGALERLAALLARVDPPAMPGAPASEERAESVAARIEALGAWAETRVARAEEAAAQAHAEVAQLTIALANAPRPELVRAQAEHTASARAKSRDLAVQLKGSQREVAAMSVRIEAAEARAYAAEGALRGGRDTVSPIPETTRSAPIGRWAQPTVASAVRHEHATRATAASSRRSAGGGRTAPREPLRGVGYGESIDEGGEASGGAAAMEEVRAILIDFLHTAAAVVEPPLPSGLGLGEESIDGTPSDQLLGSESLQSRLAPGEDDHAAVVRAFAAVTLRRQRAYVELAQQMQPMMAVLQRISAALRSRRLLRSVREEMGDGTLEGLALEVEGLVEAESARQADLAGSPAGVAQHVLHKVQTSLEVQSVGEIGPRIDDLTRAARLSLSLLKMLRDALDLDSDANINTCIATAARAARGHKSLAATAAHLAALLEVHSVEALVPAVRQLCLRGGRHAQASGV